jgi:tRNA C32,U32 (ribose-2'-O)-methylase TrmJ
VWLSRHPPHPRARAKQRKKASSKDEDESDIDDEVMDLLVHKMSKFMKKRGYGARNRRDYMKEHVRLC